MPVDPRDLALCVETDLAERGAVVPPIAQSALFAQPDFETLISGLESEQTHSVYTRGLNPTVEILEEKLAALERGETDVDLACKATGSGMAAISATFLGLLKAGDRILFVNHIYGPTLQLAEHLRRFGIEYDLAQGDDPQTVEAALRPETRLLWTENPGTMVFRTIDLRAIAAIARERGVLVGVDNSWATPLFYKPFEHGADVVMHAVSKYLGGHSDVLAGAIVARRELLKPIFTNGYMLGGGILSPHDAWLILRGLRTLPIRMRRHEESGLRVAQFLAEHPTVRRVHHPGLGDLAEGFRGSSGLLSFELVDDDFEAVRRVLDALRVVRLGVSWGGPEHLAISPARRDNAETLRGQGIPTGLIRLSVGLGDVDELLADLDQALRRVA